MITGKRLSKKRGVVPSIAAVLGRGLVIFIIATLASCTTSPAPISTSEIPVTVAASATPAPPSATASPAPPSPTEVPALTAKLAEMVGVVEVQNGGQAPFNPVSNGFVLNALMQLQTQVESQVRLDLSTGSIVRVGPSTIFSLGMQKPDPAGGLISQIELQAGKLWIVLNGGALDVTTPSGLASVSGSYMFVWEDPDTHTITVMCLEGTCSYTDAAGTVQLTEGQKLTSTDPNVLSPVAPMNCADLMNWASNAPEAGAMVDQVMKTLDLCPQTNPTPEHNSKDKPPKGNGGG